MSSAPNHGASNVPETALSSKTSPVLAITGHAQKIFGHVRIENLVAGLSGGVVSTLILHPLDLVKIRFAGTILNLKSVSFVFFNNFRKSNRFCCSLKRKFNEHGNM